MIDSDPTSVVIRRLTADESRARVADLSAVLMDCVEGGASVGFMTPLAPSTAVAFWNGVADGVARGERIVLVAQDRGGDILGTVQLATKLPENQPHRADVAKMLVRRSARRRGIAAQLMRAIEREAHAAGRTLLVLDTVADSPAQRLYEQLGWIAVGVIPGFALWPDGRPCAATFFYKELSG